MAKIKPDFNTPPPIIDENSSMAEVAEKIKYLDHNNITLANSSIVFVRKTEEVLEDVKNQVKNFEVLLKKKQEVTQARRSAPPAKVQTFTKKEIVESLMKEINPSELEKFKLDDAIKKATKKRDGRIAILAFANIIFIALIVLLYFKGANGLNDFFTTKQFAQVSDQKIKENENFVERMKNPTKQKLKKTMVFRTGTKYKCKGYEEYDLSIEETTNMNGYEKDGKFYFEAALDDGKAVECFITSDYF